LQEWSQQDLQGRRKSDPRKVMLAPALTGGCIFHGSIEVTPISEPQLLSEAEAERWKPFELEP
jgi:hypothetical protein